MLQIKAIQVPEGLIIDHSLSGLIVNDGSVTAKPTFSPNWILFETNSITSIKKKVAPKLISTYFQLKSSLKEKIKDLPEVLSQEQVGYNPAYDSWSNEEYESYRNMYETKRNYSEETFEDFPFQIEIIAKLKKIPDVADFNFPSGSKKSSYNGNTINYSVKYSDILFGEYTEIFYPGIVKPLLPCKLSWTDTFKIIAEHVNIHADRSVCEVSIYDDLHTIWVDKLIELDTPEAYQAAINPFAKKPKYETRYRKHRKYRVFSSDKGSNLPLFQGQNLEDLKNNINMYLNSLIAFINEPLKDCPHCQGKGVIIGKFNA